jgi:tRNA (mo5U34)-methyltransferase
MSEVQASPRNHGRLESASAMRGDLTRLGPWFHNLHLPDGTQTAPQHLLGDFPAVKWCQIAPWVAADLKGCRALDIGCNAGFYSFELARRGAELRQAELETIFQRAARRPSGGMP